MRPLPQSAVRNIEHSLASFAQCAFYGLATKSSIFLIDKQVNACYNVLSARRSSPALREATTARMTITDAVVAHSTSNMPKLLFTRSEAAEMLSLSIRTVDTLIGNKQLKAVRIGSAVRIALDELQRFMRRDHTTDRGLTQ
jgi:excisionase family DNA binding protein